MNTASDNGSAGSDGYDSDNGARTPDGYGLDRDEMAELLGALLELRSSLRKVQWYGGRSLEHQLQNKGREATS